MKFILVLFLTTTALRAQVPHIDYMIADEAKSQLQIHGTFGPDHTGGATIEGVPCSVRFWSDTMVICDLPDSGAGSGGHVIVQQMSGTSNARMLSIFKMSIERDFSYAICKWFVSWRLDIDSKSPSSKQAFANSKVSYGSYEDYQVQLYSYKLGDSSLAGKVDHLDLTFSKISMTMRPSDYPTNYQIRTIPFDSVGKFRGYSDVDTPNYPKAIAIDTISFEILFPPIAINSATQHSQASFDLIKIFSRFTSEDHQISFETEEPLGEITASLYSIDGRLLRQEKISIPAAGMYLFDMNGIHSGMGFLVLKTQKGIVAGKVVF